MSWRRTRHRRRALSCRGQRRGRPRHDARATDLSWAPCDEAPQQVAELRMLSDEQIVQARRPGCGATPPLPAAAVPGIGAQRCDA